MSAYARCRFSHKTDVLLAVSTVSTSLSGVCCGIIIALVSSRKGTSQRSAPQYERDTDDTRGPRRNEILRGGVCSRVALFWTLFCAGPPLKQRLRWPLFCKLSCFPSRWLIDLIISAKVHRALSKYPGAIATTLTEVNEICEGRTWTWLDFSKLWHLHSARRWRGNGENTGT